jgi:hypothetical protein
MYLLHIAQRDNYAARVSGRVEKRIYGHDHKPALAGFPDDFALEAGYLFMFLKRIAKGFSSVEKSVGKDFEKKLAYGHFIGESRDRSSSAIKRYDAHSAVDRDDSVRDTVQNSETLSRMRPSVLQVARHAPSRSCGSTLGKTDITKV